MTSINETLSISKHALERTMERTTLNENQAKRFIGNAFERGCKKDELPMAWQKKYITQTERDLYNGLTDVRVYNNYIFIFSATKVLITMYPLPEFFSKKKYFNGKSPIRNIRKFNRICDTSYYKNGCYEPDYYTA